MLQQAQGSMSASAATGDSILSRKSAIRLKRWLNAIDSATILCYHCASPICCADRAARLLVSPGFPLSATISASVIGIPFCEGAFTPCHHYFLIFSSLIRGVVLLFNAPGARSQSDTDGAIFKCYLNIRDNFGEV